MTTAIEGRAKWKGLGEFKVDTMDLTTAVITGLVAVTVTYYAGFLDRVIWMMGPYGPVVASMFLYSWFFVPMAVAGYLRRKWLVCYVSALTMNLIRWFMGDPDGPLLAIFAIVTTTTSIVIGTTISGGWRDKLYWWFVYGWLGGFGDAWVFFLFFGGIAMFGGDWFAFIVGRIGLAGIGWGLLWIVGRLIAARLVVAGVPRPE